MARSTDHRTEAHHPADTLTLWLISDGKRGHENQTMGLAEAISRHTNAKFHSISITNVRGLIRRLRSASTVAAKYPKPDFIIGAGHATHPSLLWLARRHRSRSIVLMRPSLPIAWFDLCIAPSHDFPEGYHRPNLLTTRGALNRVIYKRDTTRQSKLILIGGPSSHHGWDGQEILKMLARISADGDWTLSDSRRTPEGFTDLIRMRLPHVHVHSHHQTGPDWVTGQLSSASEVWVTEDSVSMIHEALTSGANLGLLPCPRRQKHSRVTEGIDALIGDGFVTPFTGWTERGVLSPPPEQLQEADRCARLILDRFSPGESPLTV